MIAVLHRAHAHCAEIGAGLRLGQQFIVPVHSPLISLAR